MLHAILQTFLYALLASFSALAMAATIAVLQTGRLKSLAFGVGFVAGQLVTCVLFVLVGGATVGSDDKRHPEIQAVLELLVASALVALALRIRARGPVETDGSSRRAGALLERLRQLRLPTMVLAGLLLGIGGPKRLLLAAFAATSIATAGVGGVAETALVVWYVALASAIVWVPVLLFLVFGERSMALMTTAQRRLAGHQDQVVAYALLAVAAALAVDAIGLF